MRIVIIEDEPLIAENLREAILAIYPEHVFVKELHSVEGSIQYFRSTSDFDLVFSDIQLEDGDCFEIFNEVTLNCPVIFCTAYQDQAFYAFETNAVDFILKPYNEERLKKAFQKIETLIFNSKSQDKSTAINSILGTHIDKKYPIEIHNIAFFYIKNAMSFASDFSEKQFYIKFTLDELEKRVGKEFYRANRKYLINKKVIKSYKRLPERKLLLDLTVKLHESVTISKEKIPSFIKWLNETT